MDISFQYYKLKWKTEKVFSLFNFIDFLVTSNGCLFRFCTYCVMILSFNIQTRNTQSLEVIPLANQEPTELLDGPRIHRWLIID